MLSSRRGPLTAVSQEIRRVFTRLGGSGSTELAEVLALSENPHAKTGRKLLVSRSLSPNTEFDSSCSRILDIRPSYGRNKIIAGGSCPLLVAEAQQIEHEHEHEHEHDPHFRNLSLEIRQPILNVAGQQMRPSLNLLCETRCARRKPPQAGAAYDHLS